MIKVNRYAAHENIKLNKRIEAVLANKRKQTRKKKVEKYVMLRHHIYLTQLSSMGTPFYSTKHDQIYKNIYVQIDQIIEKLKKY